MRRRPSGSTNEEEDESNKSDESHASQSTDSNETSRNNLKPVLHRSDSKSRRKRGTKAAWQQDSPAKGGASETEVLDVKAMRQDSIMDAHTGRRRARLRNPWSFSVLAFLILSAAAALMLTVWWSFTTRQLDPKGGSMSYMASAFVRFPEFDTEHTPFATKYNLYLYREMGVDEDPRVKGVPVLFIPGNAGSYKQVRSLASEAENYFEQFIRPNQNALNDGKRALDFFTVDFNEDFTAFHGQTLLDQAEYLNDAIAYILRLYHDPEHSKRDPRLPDPSSVILIGHSMGGVVARAMLTMHNYQANSVNTIITLSAPHARAPVSFDSLMISTYREINEYWRTAHSRQWGTDNPLWHVTLVSIAGGGLDTIVPSDYSSIASLVPDTHGFTVFTSTIPTVWTGMDHLAITWCDEFRKVVIRALYDVMDVSRPAQTKVRGDRMRSFKKHFLTGLEDIAERTLPHRELKTLLTLDDSANSMLGQGERLVLHGFGQHGRKRAYLLPIPPQGVPSGRKFTLLTDQHLDAPGETGSLEVLFCSIFPLHGGQSGALFSMNMDLSGDSTGSSRLACKNAAADVVRLPASTRESRFPFDKNPPFSYLQYNLEDLAEHQFVAVVDKASERTAGWVIAEFNDASGTQIRPTTGINRLLRKPLHIRLPAKRPMMVEIKAPKLKSSLLAYQLTISVPDCNGRPPLFLPLARQYITDIYESKFFVNARDSEINVHGVAPYMPPALRDKDKGTGLSLQIWTDPTCERLVDITLRLDVLGSFGKLWMRYRTLFAAFPLVVVALVLKKQFKVYDETGTFMSFSESLNQCLKRSIPTIFIGLTFLATYLAQTSHGGTATAPHWFNRFRGNTTSAIGDYTKNDLLIGSPDHHFWFLVPAFGIISVGLCIAINYATLCITHLLTAIYTWLQFPTPRLEDGKRTPSTFAVTSARQRIATTSILLVLVSTVIPYQFAYLVLCVVDIATSVRALRVAWETRSDANYNFYNYTHSILILMLWILPINLPVLVVWIRNLSVHWLTPFSSHHNILSIMPFILLVETLSTGRMIPRINTRLRYVTNALLYILSVYAALYGASYAYLLHHVVNIFSAWLVLIHWSTGSFEFNRVFRLLDPGADVVEGYRDGKKRP